MEEEYELRCSIGRWFLAAQGLSIAESASAAIGWNGSALA
jgi:hypothetical protein